MAKRITTNITANPKKLRDGSWGAVTRNRVPRVGDLIEIHTKAGKVWMARVEAVLWDNGQQAIVKTSSVRSGSSTGYTRKKTSKWCECGYAEDMLSLGYMPGQKVRCPECGGIAEAC